MDLSRRWRWPPLMIFILLACVQTSQSRFYGLRPKRQNGANMYLPESSITPGGEGDPSEWTEWSSPSECSRSCGGGVSYQTRECLRTAPNGAPLCSGGDRKYFSCNTQDCPEDEPDFRAQQCSRFNHVPFDGIHYEWVPYTNAPNPCELNCMPVGERFYYRQKAKVIDGTRCNDKELNVCVNGECQPVGCDMMLGSSAKEDKCRKCGGDGSSCKTIADKFTTSNLAAGYNDILLIPAGATNIRIQETAPSNNYLACRNLTGHYYLNGNWRIDFPRPMFYVGSWWNYQRKPTGFAAPDQLTASGPTTEPIYIVMLVQDKNVSIDYEYSIPQTVSQRTPEVYSWTHMEFGPCSASCGGGTQSRTVTCNNRLNLEEVHPSLCDEKAKPAESQECGQEPCAPHWVPGEWNKCSKGCGSDGVQERTVTCERISPDGEHTAEEDSVCLEQVGNKPATQQECNRDVKNCPKYHLGPWTPCDKLCGEGKQRRKVTCYMEENGRKKVLSDEDCVEEKPETEKNCMMAPCEGVDWIISQWSECDSCGQQTETRTAICGSKSGKVYPDEFCAPEVPLLSRPCESKKCKTLWFTSEWSKCSTSCGKGVQSRIVMCGQFDGMTVTAAADESECDASTKPDSEQECEGEEKECPGQWFTGPWEPCSKSCGGGERVREVFCLANGTKSLNCDESKIEAISEKCNIQPCTEDQIIPLDSTAKPVEGEELEGEEEDEEECEDDDDEDDDDDIDDADLDDDEEVKLVTGKMGDEVKLGDGIELDKESTTIPSLITDELMLSDAPSSDGTTTDDDMSTVDPLSTVEGSGDGSETTERTSLVTEGSGEEVESTVDMFTSSVPTMSTDPTDISSPTPTSSLIESSSISSASEESTLSTSGTEATTGVSVDSSAGISESVSTEGIASTDTSGSTFASESTTAWSSSTESATEPSGSTDSTGASETTEYSRDLSTEASVATEKSTGSSEFTETPFYSSTLTSVDQSSESSIESSQTTSLSTESSSESSTDTSVSTESSTEASTDSSVSTESSSEVSTESTTEFSTESSLSTESSAESSMSTESTKLSTDETSVTSSEFTTESGEGTSTTSALDTESTSSSSTEVSIGISTESVSSESTESVSGSGATDSTTESTESSSAFTTASGGTSETSEGLSEGSSVTTEGVSVGSSVTTEGVSEGSSATTEGVSEGSSLTTEGSLETTVSSESTAAVSGSTTSEGTTVASTEWATEGASEGISTETTAGSTTSEGVSLSTVGISDFTTEASGDTLLPTDEATTVDIWTTEEEEMERSTPFTWEAAITKATKPKKCKAKKVKKDCKKTEYGCCPDGRHAAKGPFDKGCPIAKTCADTEFGCCQDGLSPAAGENFEGCPQSQCAETLFGCCPDNYTAAEGEDNEGCPEPTTVPPTTSTELPVTEEAEAETEIGAETEMGTELPAVFTEMPETTEGVVKSCSFAEFGCCPDGQTEAKGKDFMGCEDVIDRKDCRKSIFGCCNDGRTAATGPDRQGCPSCTNEPYGCCPDNETPAHGPLGEGCCLNSPYGCCPDNINSARGPNFQDCGCEYTPYGCCPDKKEAARGPNNEGCSCESLPFGCCPDKLTPAQGPKFEGCPCHTLQFGCCPDGITIAQGPHHYGCHCSQTEYKCCPDEQTPAKGPNNEGCTCLESKFGCCPDGATPAQGDKFEGCENVREPPQKACGLPKETGPCGNFSIKYFFDTSYGACARFWYGGCEGNGNRFDTEADCKATCQDYEGKEACLLPKSSGPCTGYNKKWYFDSDRNRCEEFNYGGCYGTNNRFDSLQECQSLCTLSESIPPCEQPMDEGPCEGNFERWFYDNETDVCRPFRYGGCKGNKNNHATEHACNYNCRQPGVLKDYCSLPKQTGDCSEQHARWYFSESEKRCTPFYYTGCGGNRNNFRSLDSCEEHCPRPVVKDLCEIPAEVGECTKYTAMWYFDTKEARCRQFYYGGCGGSENRFATEEACMQRCEKRPEPEPQPEVAPPPPSGDLCALPAETGDCRNFTLLWHFDSELSACRQFYYGGCGGNQNRFGSQEDCVQRCVARTPAPVRPTPPARRPEPRPTAEEDVCSLPETPGDCDNYVVMWYYSAPEARCRQFYYGGCGGNGNRFQTEDECNRRCLAPPERAPAPEPEREPDFDIGIRLGEAEAENVTDTEKCFLPPAAGDCGDRQTRWFYNSADGLCERFAYSGCGGNANNYESEDECQNQCFDVQTTCSLPPLRGACNDSITRWYYDQPSGKCREFDFTGCRGNRNNFVSERDCMYYCGNEQPPTLAYSVCELPLVAGDCDNHTTAWYYDSDTMNCFAFTYSGCGGNGNRFQTKEQCERQCGEFKGVDVCNEPVMTGPCRQWQTRFYFNKVTRTCDPFTYGGCEGTGNRFEDRAECESVCILGQEPQTRASKDICRQNVEIGRCSDGASAVSERRWFYDDSRGTCVAFIYSGCSGNQNNFRSFESCYNFCAKEMKPEEFPTDNEVVPSRCDSFERECQELRCPFGMRRVPIDEECSRCECENPCENYSCPEGQQCAVDVSSEVSGQFVAVCRLIHKPGECPHLVASSSSSSCARECYTDADCRADNKCCSDGCGFVCVRPTQPTVHTTPPTTAAPRVIYPGEVRAALEPKKKQELDVQTPLGGIAVLRCFATGIPPPNVTWSRHNVVIDTNQGRYVLTSNGDLTIVQVRQTDSGSYVCVASNGLGEPVRREVELQVTEPKPLPAYVYGDKNATQIVTLNKPAQVRCPAGGYPAPNVSWWRNRQRLPLVTNRFEFLRDYSLMFRSIQLSDLGPYTCEVWNHAGRPASIKVTLKAIGPARAATPDDAQYLQYVIDPARAPTTQRPSFPYRPTRPAAVPPPPPVYAEPPRPPTVRAEAIIAMDPGNHYVPGSTIAMACSVQGHPKPDVTWTKDSVPLLPSERIQITSEPYRLVISNVTAEDSGKYGCTARNAISYSISEESVVVEPTIPVHPDCIDNPYFANCQLIVKGHYCRNQYYAKFCCRSCTLAGQISVLHPNAL